MTVRLDLAIIAADVDAGARVLDVGCGDGALMAELRGYADVDGRSVNSYARTHPSGGRLPEGGGMRVRAALALLLAAGACAKAPEAVPAMVFAHVTPAEAPRFLAAARACGSRTARIVKVRGRDAVVVANGDGADVRACFRDRVATLAREPHPAGALLGGSAP